MNKWLSCLEKATICTRLDADSLIFLCLHVCFSGNALHPVMIFATGKLEWLCPSDWKLSAHLNAFWPQWVDDEGNTDAIICCMLYRSKRCINKTLAFTDTPLYSNAMACVELPLASAPSEWVLMLRCSPFICSSSIRRQRCYQWEEKHALIPEFICSSLAVTDHPSGGTGTSQSKHVQRQ